MLGLGDDGEPFTDPAYEIDLQSWVPPDNWSSRIYREKVIEGNSLPTNNFHDKDEESLSKKIIFF